MYPQLHYSIFTVIILFFVICLRKQHKPVLPALSAYLSFAFPFFETLVNLPNTCSETQAEAMEDLTGF